MVKLFESDRLIGMFKGFTEGGLEFRAEIVAPYQSSEDLTPRIGQFLLVELGSPDEAALGRITRFFPVGVLAGQEGDEYLAEMHRSSTDVPAQLKERRLRYNVHVRLLGGIKIVNSSTNRYPQFVPTVRKLPHLGAKVALPSDQAMAFLCNLGSQSSAAQEIGHFNLGEIIYNGGQSAGEDFLVPQSPSLPINFDVRSLIARRSFVFARAGYGKSNLLKLLISQLYAGGIPKDDKDRPVGMLILDPEGEYFWPDDSGRPGLCNVPNLQDNIAVFTNRTSPNPYYGSWRCGGIKLDVRDLHPSDVISLCIPAEKQDNQNVAKLRGVARNRWRELIDLAYKDGYNATDSRIIEIGGWGKEMSQLEIGAMRSNLITIVRRLHDPEGSLQREVINLLARGMIVIVDLSLVSGAIGLELSGLLLKSIFDNNQQNFTTPDAGKGVVPTIAVLEEAQSVLGRRTTNDESPFVEWAKEGRKYGLGAIMVTQQPGSISSELLSQGDNFFAFHLLSAGDLKALQQHNAHFSDDILASILNEPIKGNCFFWSAPDQPFVLPARVLSFDDIGSIMPQGDELRQEVDVAANRLKGVAQKSESRIVEAVRDTITSTDKQAGVKFYEPSTQRPDQDEVACYKPHLSAQVANKLDESDKNRFCSSANLNYVTDHHLAEALKSSGLVSSVVIVKAPKPNDSSKTGDYYLIPRSAIGEIKLSGRIQIQIAGNGAESLARSTDHA